MGGFYLGGVQELVGGKGKEYYSDTGALTREQAIFMGCGY
jgi:hypothetical protein